MSKLDKEQVLADFSKAYEKANGKAPTIEQKGSWYNVDGGKSIRLADFVTLTEELQQGKTETQTKSKKEEKPKKAATAKADDKKAPAKKAPAKKADAPKKAEPKKATVKKAAPKKAAAKEKKPKVQSSGTGLLPKDAWLQYLSEQNEDCRAPRGMQ